MTRSSKAVPAPELSLFFGRGFLHDHVGQIVDDPTIAISELVANCYDAGADEVHVRWPDLPGEVLSVADNGTGMTRQQFERRWRTLSYDREAEQGTEVVFPTDVTRRNRSAFGHNGKGRFSPFCFADEYAVETWRDGHVLRATVKLTPDGPLPFSCDVDRVFSKQGHGTLVSVTASRLTLRPEHVREVIGFRFAVDPSFQVLVNGEAVKLLTLGELVSRELRIDGYGSVLIHRLDPRKQERTMRLKGIAWWVNKRMVGEPSWDGLDSGGRYLDGRTSEAKRFSFVVEANFLKDEVKPDWSGFHATARLNRVRSAVHETVVDELRGLVSDDRKALKKEAIAQNRSLIRDLPLVSQNHIGQFLEQVQEKCPSLTPPRPGTHSGNPWQAGTKPFWVRPFEPIGSLRPRRPGYLELPDGTVDSEQCRGCSQRTRQADQTDQRAARVNSREEHR